MLGNYNYAIVIHVYCYLGTGSEAHSHIYYILVYITICIENRFHMAQLCVFKQGWFFNRAITMKC